MKMSLMMMMTVMMMMTTTTTTMMMMMMVMMMMIIIIIIIICPQIPGFCSSKTERTEINQKASKEFCTVLSNVLKTELIDEALTRHVLVFLSLFRLE